MKARKPEARKPVGRPPYPPADLSKVYVARMQQQAKEFAKHPGKLKAWLQEKRLFHILLQDHLATAPLPGASGIQLNAASSKLFLEMSADLAEALGKVEDEDEDDAFVRQEGR